MNWFLRTYYKTIYSARYAAKVFLESLRLWPFKFWLRFWLAKKRTQEISVREHRFLLRSDTFMAKLIDLYVILENVVDERYFQIGFPLQYNPVIIDIGAHIGSFSLAAAKKNPKASIFSFEPFPDHYQLFLKNIKLSGAENISAFNMAMASDNRGRKLYIDPANNSGHSVTKKLGRFIKVPTVTLDEVFNLNKIKECDFLKMDCEGMEFEILLNAPAQTLKRVKKIALEYHDPQFFGLGEDNLLERLIGCLRNNNFEIKVIKDDYQRGYIFGVNLS